MDELGLLKKLVTYKTYASHENFKDEVSGLYDFIEATLPPQYKSKRYRKSGYESMIIMPRGKRIRVLLQAHIDVVPASHGQFKPQHIDGKLYGRGVSDMKFAAACYLKLLNDLRDKGLEFGVCFTSDEEIGGFNGVKYLLDKNLIDCEICVLPDGVNNWVIVEKEKGILHGKLSAKGKSAHGAYPWLGVSAIHTLLQALDELQKNIIFKQRSVKNHWYNTLNIGVINGGTATNIVADTAGANLDIRLVSAEAEKDVLKAIESICHKYKVDFEQLVHGHCVQLDKTNKYVVLYEKILHQYGITYSWDIDHGASDGRFFSERGIPVLMAKPICGGDHTENEWIDTKSLRLYYKTLKSFIVKALE